MYVHTLKIGAANRRWPRSASPKGFNGETQRVRISAGKCSAGGKGANPFGPFGALIPKSGIPFVLKDRTVEVHRTYMYAVAMLCFFRLAHMLLHPSSFVCLPSAFANGTSSKNKHTVTRCSTESDPSNTRIVVLDLGLCSTRTERAQSMPPDSSPLT